MAIAFSTAKNSATLKVPGSFAPLLKVLNKKTKNKAVALSHHGKIAAFVVSAHNYQQMEEYAKRAEEMLTLMEKTREHYELIAKRMEDEMEDRHLAEIADKYLDHAAGNPFIGVEKTRKLLNRIAKL